MNRAERVIAARRKQLIKQLLDGQSMAASNYDSAELEFDINVWVDCLAANDICIEVEQYNKADATQYHAEPVYNFTKHFKDVEAALEWLETQGVNWTRLHATLPPPQ